MKLENHPCFNESACRSFGRIHLPVAPRCNVQCNFCNRKFDCINESRPGVTSGVLSPSQAFRYLEEVMAEKGNISVVGIAGPGDPFANPEETLETLERVRKGYPEILLCLATNGLNLSPYLDEIARLRVSHVSITVNAVDPAIGARIYAWVRKGKRTVGPKEGANILLENQVAAIKGMKERGLMVKVNSIILPGVNSDHIEKIAAEMAALHVDILNCMPYYPNPGSKFEDMEEPSKEMTMHIRKLAGVHIKQMRHCTRCRADAVGLLGETPDERFMKKIKIFEGSAVEMQEKEVEEERPYVAVTSMEGMLVNQHLGEAHQLLIFTMDGDEVSLVDARPAPEPGGGVKRWVELSDSLKDCRTLLVNGIGDSPKSVLSRSGIEILEVEGLIDDAVRSVFQGRGLHHHLKRERTTCGAACSGGGMGCM